MPVTVQCRLLKLSRSTLYFRPSPVSETDLSLMRKIDMIHLRSPFLGGRRIRYELNDQDYPICRKKVQRLMRKMGIVAL